jgi:hypothetical protein
VPAAPFSRPLSVRGFFRAYDFTRQNASTGIGGAGQVNQQSIELGLGLHADYRFGNTPLSVGASYLFATPANGCASPVSHPSPPCGKLKAPSLNPDDSLPGFELNALYEAYVQYKDPRQSPSSATKCSTRRGRARRTPASSRRRTKVSTSSTPSRLDGRSRSPT